MLTPVWSGRFKRDVRRAQKRGKDMDKLKAVRSLLIEEQPLSAAYRDHPLKGEWKGFHDLHIEPDWLLLYRIDRGELQLARTGTHADFFDEETTRHRRTPLPGRLEPGVQIDRDAAGVVADRQGAAGLRRGLDEVGMTGDGPVHSVVAPCGGQVVRCGFVAAAEQIVHAVFR